MESKTINVDGIEYMPMSECKAKEVSGTYVIVRARSAGVHAGYLQFRNGQEVELSRSRRLWYWDGANSLSQLAMEGTAEPENCKFPCEVPTQHIFDMIEVIPATEVARKSIQAVKVWAWGA